MKRFLGKTLSKTDPTPTAKETPAGGERLSNVNKSTPTVVRPRADSIIADMRRGWAEAERERRKWDGVVKEFRGVDLPPTKFVGYERLETETEVVWKHRL